MTKNAIGTLKAAFFKNEAIHNLVFTRLNLCFHAGHWLTEFSRTHFFDRV
jgi:hypothetical protein